MMTSRYNNMAQVLTAVVILCFCSRDSCGLCLKQADVVRVFLPGYDEVLVHTNNCLEISGSLVKPEIEYGSQHENNFKREVLDSCCCRVTNYSEQKMQLKKNDSPGHLVVYFKRIESCGCIPCHQEADRHVPHSLFTSISSDAKEELQETLSILDLV